MERRFEVRKRDILQEAEIQPEVSEGMLKRLEHFTEPFVASLGRPEPRENARIYLCGLLSDLKRKNTESIAYRYDREPRALQRFVGFPAWDHRPLQQEELAELACHIEIERLQEPIGKQDQYIAAYGGITSFTFQRDGKVLAKPLQIPVQTLFELEDHLLLFFTGFSRSAGSILKDQKVRSQQNDQEMLNNLHYVKELGHRSKEALENGNTQRFGELMHEHWGHKKRRSGGMSNPQIDQWYQLALKHGAIGGKLVGAGGGGFLMFLTEDRIRLRKAMSDAGLDEVRFRFDFEGTKIILSS